MITTLSIRTKLLVWCVLLIFFAMTGISAAYYVLIKRGKQQESRERIQIAFDIILDDFHNRGQLYARQLDEFLKKDTTLNWAAHTYNQDHAVLSAPQFIVSSLVRAATELKNTGKAMLLNEMALYGADRRLLLIYQNTAERETVGSYVVSASGQETYLPMENFGTLSAMILNRQPIPDVPLPEGVPATYDGDFLPSMITDVFSTDQQLGFKIRAPIYHQQTPVGMFVCKIFFTQAMVERYASLSKTEINFFAGVHFRLGTLPAQQALIAEKFQQLQLCDEPKGAARLQLTTYTFAQQAYYQGGCALGESDARTGAIIVSLSQAIEQREIQRIFTTLLIVSGVSIAVCLIFVSMGLVPVFTTPIITLTAASEQLAKGDLRHPISTSGRDELGVLARSFVAMRAEIQRRIQELEQFNAELEQRVKDRTAEIARQKYILDTFMANIPDAIYFKDRESRFIQSNQAHARLLGVADPSELVGKSDFDFYPADQVQPRYEQEQEILRTGQPLLNFEEANIQQSWTLTTKMPLRDERGDMIGTFGISRDITELKQAQQALHQAYSEISVLNQQLQYENARMSAELDVVKRLQQMILPRPKELQHLPGLDIVGYMEPADEVGGDYYDVLHDQGVLHIGIGDVTGHGLESGVLMLMTQAAVRTLIEHGETDPVKFVNTLNRLIYKNVERMGSDKNLTFALVQYQGGQLKLVGQHEDALVVRKGGQVERVDTINLGFLVGLEPEISQWVRAATITLHPGDGLVLYTDGIIEAINLDNQQYGLDRLCAVVSAHWRESSEVIKQAVVNDVKAHIGAQKVYDDITLVVLKQQ